MKKEILSIMQVIAEELKKETSSLQNATYNDQRTLIKSFFMNNDYGRGIVMKRLVVIDSLYSTNAAYSYFSFDEMAKKICSLGSEEQAREYFYNVALTGNDPKNLFGEQYGIQKNLSEGSKQMSLLSKYAYYLLIGHNDKYPLGFPIYDSLAKESYSTVCKMLGKEKVCSLPAMDTPTIDVYIKCLKQLRHELFGSSTELFHGFQQYDILDAYLWRMGKFENGNLSLLLERADYIRFVKNLELEADDDDAKYRERMVEKYAHTPAVDSKGKFNFNKAVALSLLKNKKPFKDVGNEVYLNTLLSHWMQFHQKKISKK